MIVLEWLRRREIRRELRKARWRRAVMRAACREAARAQAQALGLNQKQPDHAPGRETGLPYRRGMRAAEPVYSDGYKPWDWGELE